MRRVLTIASILIAGLLTPAAAQPRATNIAVLPLDNPSGDKNAQYFSDALTDEIAVTLTKVPGLAITGRSSVFQDRAALRDLSAMQSALKTDYFVEGTAQKDGDALHLTLRLVRAGTTAPLWTAQYDRPFSAIFDVEEDIARNVAAKLNHAVSAGGDLVRIRTKDMAVYDDYLRAKAAARGRGAQSLDDAARLLEAALARDPGFEPAAAMLAYDDALIPLFAPALRGNKPDVERQLTDRLLPRADIFARRAVALDPKDSSAWVGLAYVRLVQHNMIAAEDAFREAIRLNPNQADGLHGYSQFVAAMGKVKESLVLRDHLQAIEPSLVQYTADTAEIYWVAGDTEKAIRMLQPFRPGRTLELAIVLSASGRYHEAASVLREMPQTNWPDGLLEKAAKLLDMAPAQLLPDSMPALGSLSFTFLHVGAPERVLEYYEDEVKGGYFQPISATWFWHPSYAPVRRTERFRKLVRDLGMVDYWRARGWPQYCHPTSANDFTCN